MIGGTSLLGEGAGEAAAGDCVGWLDASSGASLVDCDADSSVELSLAVLLLVLPVAWVFLDMPSSVCISSFDSPLDSRNAIFLSVEASDMDSSCRNRLACSRSVSLLPVSAAELGAVLLLSDVACCQLGIAASFGPAMPSVVCCV